MKYKLFAALAVWLGLAGALVAWESKPEPTLPDGKVIQVPLPKSEHMQNVGGSDGAGLCVYTSVVLAAKWHNIPEAVGLRKFAEGRPGGSYPEKLASDIKTYSLRANVKLPTYVQHTGGDDAFLDLCLKTRRYPGITYAGRDDFYRSTIAHMVNLVHLDDKFGVIQDNNRAGKWTSDSRQKVLNRWKGLDDEGRPLRIGGMAVGGGWAFVWIAPPAPPLPPKAADPIEATGVKCGAWERFIIGDAYKGEWDERGWAVWVYWVDGEALGGFYKNRFYDLVWDEEGKLKDLGPEKAAPAGVCPPTCEPTDDCNKGIDVSRVSTTSRYWINDVEVNRAQAYALVSDVGDGLVDDSDKYHLSIVGYSGAGEKAQLLAKFAPGGPFEKYARRLHVQVYAADSWPAKTVLTSPVTLQEPASLGGKVVGVAKDWTDESVRKVLGDVFDTPVKPAPVPAPVNPDPIVKPAPDDKPNEPKSEPKSPVWVWAIGGLVLLVWYAKKGK